MREIEFKAKRVDDGVWVYGSYTAMKEDDTNDPFRSDILKTYYRIWQYEAGDWNMGGYANYEVIPETVCQFTGLKDKNGVDIYEGDRFKYCAHDGYFLDDFTGTVVFKDVCFGFTTKTGYFVKFSELKDIKDEFLGHIEVTGNIYDN